MGIYLNPNAEAFKQSLRSEIYVDKSLILVELNKLAETDKDFVCMSRARRFGKSMAGNMISAYYSKGCDTGEIFSKMKIGKVAEFDKNLNRFNVIKLDLNGWYQRAIQEKKENVLLDYIQSKLLGEFRKEFPSIHFEDNSSLASCILNVYEELQEKFVIIIDEYDVLVREQVSESIFQSYLSFLNSLFKDSTLRPAFALAYITGIIPIVRDKVQSKLNEFREYTMLNPRQFAGMIGFTNEEVEELCTQHGLSKDECKRWYNGYNLNGTHIYNSHSVVCALLDKKCRNNWSTTGSFEAISDYIKLNFEGIRNDVVSMLAGERIDVEVTSFTNTLNNFKGKDDVFTYLIHLGYLTYDEDEMKCYIPNEEIRQEWIKAVKFNDDYNKLMTVINTSKKLLDDTINGNEEAVAKALDAAHCEVTSNLTYNDEHCFQSAISLAYFYANTRYTVVKEMPTGKGYADIVFIPYVPNIPAMVVELKHNKSAESALKQIKDKNYCQALNNYNGDILFVGINYDEKTKEHKCKIEKV